MPLNYRTSRKAARRRADSSTVERLERRALFAARIVGDSTVYATIQAAVDAAASGATVNVDPGNYPELVSINKPLTLRGAQAGVDGRSNVRGTNETVITGIIDSASGNTISCIYVNANGVTVDGFTVQGNSSNGNLGAGVVIAPNKNGSTIVNNILQNNVAGLYLSNNSTTRPAIIRNNLFFNNNLHGDHSGRGIYTNGGFTGGNLTNVIIDSNAFISNYGSTTTTTGLEAAIALQTLAENAQSNIRITNNMFDNNGKACLFFNSDNVLIEGNLITWTKDLYSAALRFEGGNKNITIRGNTMFANPGNVVRIDNKVSAGMNYNFSITGNNIYMNGLNTTTKASIVVDPGQYSGSLDATNNWWGSATGPASNAVIANGNEVSTSPFATTRFAHPTNPSYMGLPWTSDGPVQVENFDHGGLGITYHDMESSNLGGAKVRQPWGVDIQPTTDIGGGYNIGYVKAGEWLQYTVNVPAAGTYNLDVRVANSTTGGQFHVEVGGVNVSGSMTIPNTGGYQKWQTITRSVTLPAGLQTVRLVMDVNNSTGSIGNFNWFQFRGTSTIPAPAAPTNLVATLSGSSANLSWTDNAGNESGFIVERKVGGGAWQLLTTTSANVTSYTDANLAASTTFTYRVRAMNSAGESANSNEAVVVTPAQQSTTYLSDLPWSSAFGGYGPVEKDMSNGGSGAGDGAPITLNGVVYSKGLGTHAHSEIVYNLAGQYAWFLSDVGVDDRQTTSGSVVFQVFADNVKVYDSGVMGPTTATKNINVNVSGVQTLKLVVTDGGDGISFDHADWAGARVLSGTTSTPPAAPTGLSATAIAPTRIDLAWNDVSNETGYRVERSTNNVNFAPVGPTLSAGVTSYSDTTVSASTTYYYRIVAINPQDESAPSNVASATTPAVATAPTAPSNLVATPVSASRVDLAWQDNSSNESNFVIERSTDNVNYATIATVGGNATSYIDTAGLSAGTQYFYRVRATNSAGSSGFSNMAAATTASNSLPAGWTSADIGNVGLAGSASFSGGTYTVSGAGTDIYNSADSFHFAYRQMTGDGTMIVRVASLEKTDANAKAGIMFRESLAANSRHATVAVTPNNGIKFLRRTSTGGSTSSTTTARSLKAPYWLKLVRSGNTFTSYRSADGVNWTLIDSQTISMGSTIYVGLAVTSRKTGTLATATFDNVSIS